MLCPLETIFWTQIKPCDIVKGEKALRRSQKETNSRPAWATPVAAVSQQSLLTHSYGLPQPPSFSHSVTVQSPIIGVTPSVQTPVAPQHPLMTTHFQLTPQSTQHGPSLVLSMPSQPPYPVAPPTVTPSALTAQANQVVHPNPHSIMGNGHLTSHSSLLQPPTLPLTNGQTALHTQSTAADNQDAPNGLQMLRTVGSGKYEFSDPGHPKEVNLNHITLGFLLLVTYSYMGSGRIETRRPVPSLYKQQLIHMSAAMNKALNIQAIGCQNTICNQSKFTSKVLQGCRKYRCD
ncbi:hypothetical protein XENOCAPTIV_000834 [Xenoophorus captivus]|uniref:Uncharacterized protein n=1 Tax=Xenoophorus captivus TaxID=1517983 RepID=A0ABV0RJY1_9TELE